LRFDEQGSVKKGNIFEDFSKAKSMKGKVEGI